MRYNIAILQDLLSVCSTCILRTWFVQYCVRIDARENMYTNRLCMEAKKTCMKLYNDATSVIEANRDTEK